MRRHDIDWLRVIALGMLIIYHNAVAFQPWGHLISFIQNKESSEILWLFMSIFNIWRIPILFMISGMGAYFALRNKNWKVFLKDRSTRILFPYIFGFFFICPINLFLSSTFYGKQIGYYPNPGHLWFLGNIYAYVLLLLPIMLYCIKNPDNFIFKIFRIILKHRLGIFSLALITGLEGVLFSPHDYINYAMSIHGFMLGLICFFLGFILVSMKNDFWPIIKNTRSIALVLASILCMIRFYFVFTTEDYDGPKFVIGFESMCWMLAVFGYGALYLNHQSKALTYLKDAVYPVYILHMPLQFLLSYLIMPTKLTLLLKLNFLIIGTLFCSIFLYEIIKRMNWIRPIFGLKKTIIN